MDEKKVKRKNKSAARPCDGKQSEKLKNRELYYVFNFLQSYMRRCYGHLRHISFLCVYIYINTHLNGIGCELVMDVLVLRLRNKSIEDLRHELARCMRETKRNIEDGERERKCTREWASKRQWARELNVPTFLKNNCYGRDAKTDCTCCECRLFALMEKCHTLHEVKLMAFLLIPTASHYILPANEWTFARRPSIRSFVRSFVCVLEFSIYIYIYIYRHTQFSFWRMHIAQHTTADNCLNDDGGGVRRCTTGSSSIALV